MEERFVPLAQAEGRPIETGGEQAASAASLRPIDDPRALQILSTEHWSLLTARSLVYNEAFARAGMFLAFLSATLLVLGLISNATGFSDGFLIVAAFVLALDLFVGLATLGRIIGASSEDIRYLQGMNRLRHAYFEILPGLEPYFITNGYDDFESVAMFYGPQTNKDGGIGDNLKPSLQFLKYRLVIMLAHKSIRVGDCIGNDFEDRRTFPLLAREHVVGS